MILPTIFCLPLLALATSEPTLRYEDDPVFPVFDPHTMTTSGDDLVEHKLASEEHHVVHDEHDTLSTPIVANEASRDGSDVWIIIVLCFVVCFAMRHANDFYAGDTITLVEEGIWAGRFRHKKGKERMLSHVERDFQMMYEKLDTATRKQVDILEDEQFIDTDD